MINFLNNDCHQSLKDEMADFLRNSLVASLEKDPKKLIEVFKNINYNGAPPAQPTPSMAAIPAALTSAYIPTPSTPSVPRDDELKLATELLYRIEGKELKDKELKKVAEKVAETARNLGLLQPTEKPNFTIAPNLPCHESILALHSEPLTAMFNSGFKEAANKILDLSDEIAPVLHQYLYMPDSERETFLFDSTIETMRSLVALTHRLEMKDLKEDFIYTLNQNLSKEELDSSSYDDLIEFAALYEIPELSFMAHLLRSTPDMLEKANDPERVHELFVHYNKKDYKGFESWENIFGELCCILNNAIGVEKWKELLKTDIDTASLPPIQSYVKRLLEKDPLEPEWPVMKNFELMLVPKELGSLNKLAALATSLMGEEVGLCKVSNQTPVLTYGDTPIEKSRWVLIRRRIPRFSWSVSGSKNNIARKLAEKNCELPSIMEAAVFFYMHKYKTGSYPFKDPRVYPGGTICKEFINPDGPHPRQVFVTYRNSTLVVSVNPEYSYSKVQTTCVLKD